MMRTSNQSMAGVDDECVTGEMPKPLKKSIMHAICMQLSVECVTCISKKLLKTTKSSRIVCVSCILITAIGFKVPSYMYPHHDVQNPLQNTQSCY